MSKDYELPRTPHAPRVNWKAAPLIFAACILYAVFMLAVTALADDVITVQVSGQYRQSEARQMLFGELDYTNAFDGVWACASLLHVQKDALPGVLRLIRRALKKDGVFYASFKYGETEREKNGRLFSDFTEESLRALLDEAGGFRTVKLWTTADARPERAEERWVNVLCFAL